MHAEPIDEKAIFNTARKISDASAREDYLHLACSGDPSAMQRIRNLLRVEQEERSFLEAPPTSLNATPAFPPLTEQPGDTIGPYKLLQQIGEGGMGVVYMAEQSQPIRRKVALKIVKPGMDSKQVVARFEAERQALALMDHPNIARVLDGGTTETGRPYFVMELVKGVPLTEYCDRNGLSAAHRLELFVDVCRAVQHAHHKAVIHRDLKPSNVMVTMHDGRPVPKVIDFGVSKAINQQLTEKTLFTAYGQMVGTPAYMSPEQAEMSGLDIDTRSDIYSLGVLLYELLTGSTPFESERLCTAGYAEMLRIIQEEDPPRPSTRLSTTSQESMDVAGNQGTDPRKMSQLVRDELDWIVMKALEKDRRRRYDTAANLADDVGRYLSGETVQACPPTLTYRLKKAIRRNKGAIAIVSAIGAVLLLGLVGTTYGLLNAERQRKLAAERANEADAARAEEAKRAEELQRVTEFQSEQLGKIVPELMGASLRDSIIAAAPVEQQAALRERLGRVNFTNIGLESMRANVFAPTRRAISEQFADQPMTEAQLLQSLADILLELGLLDAATEPQERALALRRKLLGNTHAKTLTSISTLGALRKAQGQYDEAESLFRETLAGRRRTLGNDHPRTLSSINNMAALLYAQGRFDEAEPFFQAAVDGGRRVLGDDDPRTLNFINNMGLLRKAQGRPDEAESHFQEALKGLRRVLGDDHPNTLSSINAMGYFLNAQARLDDAEPYYKEALDGRRRVLGDDHPDTLITINYMGYLLAALGRFDEAERFFLEALEGRRRVLGDDHPDTLSSINTVGHVLRTQDKLDEAVPHYREVLDHRRSVLGNNDPRTLETTNTLAALLVALGRYDETEPLLLAAYAALEESGGADTRPQQLQAATQRLVALYDLWNRTDQADRWREKLNEHDTSDQRPDGT
ncbi:MAG: serine/threonine-protein kinase [Methyloceanibacter sp.]|jgi:serine/threonine protein kinase/tetratricopeptide (TPR) repeat protein